MKEPVMTQCGNQQCDCRTDEDVARLRAKGWTCEAPKSHVVEGQVYRHRKTTNAEPWGYGLYRLREGVTEYQVRDADDWLLSCVPAGWLAREVASGERVPYIPPVPVFKVGDWVMGNGDDYRFSGPERVEEHRVNKPTHTVRLRHGWYDAQKLRHATDEEITAAKRITPKVGMLLERVGTGMMLQCTVVASTYASFNCLNAKGIVTIRYSDLITDHYTIRDSVTIQGVC
eukprot:GHVU01112260.1.p1 GENE.GHVU01112260.1~~GHVU01112260.1.p1  ORF type:complete len:229 (-),score=22.78 GHVU01112260.1:96-782(-)